MADEFMEQLRQRLPIASLIKKIRFWARPLGGSRQRATIEIAQRRQIIGNCDDVVFLEELHRELEAFPLTTLPFLSRSHRLKLGEGPIAITLESQERL